MGALKYMSYFTACSVFIALFSLIFQAMISLKRLNKITTITFHLLSIEKSFLSDQERVVTKIATGYGVCTDLLISGTQFLNYSDTLAIDSGFVVDEIKTESDLLKTFGYFFKNGAAAERFTSNSEMFTRLIQIAKQQHRNDIQWAIGGNAALMGIRFHLEGAETLLGASMSKKLRRLVPDTIRIAGNEVQEDDIHLILEYKANERWGDLTAPRANRFILHNDQFNPYLHSAEEFGEKVKLFQPGLLVVSGLQMMDKYRFPEGVRESRLQLIQQHLISQSPSTLTHFEFASYVELDLIQKLCQLILPYADSLGMNEQELSNLYEVMTVGKTSLATDWNPGVARTLDLTRQIFQQLVANHRKNLEKGAIKSQRLISRIHVHTLAYQIILVRRQSPWRNTKAAACKASLAAHRYVCQTNMINPEAASLLLEDTYPTSENISLAQNRSLNPKEPISCWIESIESVATTIEVEICVAPVLICRMAKKAAGAGDNISAAGLLASL